MIQFVFDIMFLIISFKGNFLSEFQIDFSGNTLHYEQDLVLFFIYAGQQDSQYAVKTVDHNGEIIYQHMPVYPELYFGNMGDPYNFFEEEKSFYFTKSFMDTLFIYSEDGFKAGIAFEYGSRKLDHERMNKMKSEFDGKETENYVLLILKTKK